MKKGLVKLLIGGMILGGGVAPVIPVGNGVISYAKFIDNATKQPFYVQMDDNTYNLMGVKGGEQYNPTAVSSNGVVVPMVYAVQYPASQVIEPETTYTSATSTKKTFINKEYEARKSFTDSETKSLLQIITPVAEAAIARDATSTSGVTTATSQTWAHTIGAGANEVLFLYGFVRSTDATNLSTAKFNGTLMSTTTPAWADYLEGRYAWMMHLAAPDSGTHNIVATFNASLSTTFAAVSYSGASQTGIPDSVVTNAGDASSNNFSMSTTVVASNAWLLMSQTDIDGICSGATTPAVLINTSNPIQTDSNGVVGTGSQSLAVTGCGNRVQAKVILSFAPAADVVISSPQDLIIINDE